MSSVANDDSMHNLRLAVCIALCFTALVASRSHAQSDPRTIDRQIDARLMTRYHNARSLKPTYRAENIRDEEVRELQAVIASLDTGFITSIGPVMTPCRCEEGPACTAEVTIALQKAGHTVGRNFSKIENKWQLGLLQQWDLRYWAVQDRYIRQRVPASELAKRQQAYADELASLLADMPQCMPNTAPPAPADIHPQKADH